jgi:hypothetical protein
MTENSPPKTRRIRLYPGRRYAQPSSVVRDYGIGRSTLFKMLADEVIRSTVIRKKGSKKAIRLIDLVSLEKFLSQNATGPDNQ